MHIRVVFLLVIVFGFTTAGFAQSTRDVEAPKPPPPQYQAAKKQKKGFFLFRIFKKKEHKSDYDEIVAFRKQVRERLDDKAKEARKYDKPQYTNPLYFGHKKPPKKRKVGKKKFCKECGLVH